MNSSPRNNLLAWSVSCALAASALKGTAQDSIFLGDYGKSSNHPWRLEKIPRDEDWTRHFRIGGMVGFGIKGDFKMTSGSLSPSYADGVYDDGYVHLDSRNDPNNTSYFGYQNSSQYDGSTLTMHRANGVSLTGDVSGTGKADLSPGFDLAYGDSYWYWEHGKLGWEFGFGLMPINIRNSQPISGTVLRSAFQFDASGNFYFPSGYQGVYQNDPNSPSLPNIDPNSTPGTGDNLSGTGTSTASLDVLFYAVRLGPTLYWDLSDRLGLYAGAGPAVGFVSGSLGYHDELLLTDGSTVRANGSTSGSGITYGGYVNATLVYHAVENGDFYIGAQFMPMSGTTISGGGRSGKLNLDGQLYITAGINWPF